MKKAQIVGEAFTFILAALVFILIIGYGYSAIKSFITKQEQVAIADFKMKLEAGVEQVMLSTGSVDKLKLSLPAKYKELCLVDEYAVADKAGLKDAIAGNLQGNKHPLISQIWLSQTQNVFFTPTQDIPIIIKHVQMDDSAQGRGYCCFQTNGRIELKLKGAGDHVLVGPWNAQLMDCGK